MDNNEKLRFILKLERREKIKKIMIFVVVVTILGAILIYSNYQHTQQSTSLTGLIQSEYFAKFLA